VSVPLHFEVEVGSGGVPGLAYHPDTLTGFDTSPGDIDARQVREDTPQAG
jgi:hypothetical protein